MTRLQFLFTRITGFTPTEAKNLIFPEYFDAKTVEDKLNIIRYCAFDIFGEVTEEEIKQVYNATQESYERAYALLGA